MGKRMSELNYLELCKRILNTGLPSDDRTGVGTLSLFGEQLRFNLQAGFPAVTTKKLAWRSVVAELLWFIEGSSDERRLAEIQFGTRDNTKKTIWTANAESDYWKPHAKYNGDLGRVYGVQWRDWTNSNGEKTDQLKKLIKSLRTDPNGRRHIISAWNPGEIDCMALPPCHAFMQFYLRNNRLSCQMYQRSADVFLGVPFNIASYALLTHMIANEISATAGDLIMTFGDVHIYKNHIDAVNEQLSREPYALPQLIIANRDMFNSTVDDYRLANYESHASIKAEMAV
jgi:thymidylate synthase